MVSSMLRRLAHLEPREASGPTRILWVCNDQSAREREARDLEARGFRVVLVGWLGMMGDGEERPV